jgi:hypothetical protein
MKPPLKFNLAAARATLRLQEYRADGIRRSAGPCYSVPSARPTRRREGRDVWLQQFTAISQPMFNFAHFWLRPAGIPVYRTRGRYRARTAPIAKETGD